MNLLSIFLFLITLLSITTLNANSENKLGILLVYDANHNAQQLSNYILELTKVQCKSFAEFNIVVEFSKIKEIQELASTKFKLIQNKVINIIKQQQKKPFYKFKPIKQSKSDYYFVGNLNSKQSCKDISTYVQFAQKYAISGIIPLIGQDQHTSAMKVDLRAKQNQTFVYHKYSNSKYFQMVQNIRFIPRHIMQIASTKIREVQLMAKDLNSDCEQILMNFIIVHFYPQFRNKIFRFSNNLKIKFDKTENDNKNKCMNQYIDILGYVPVYYQKRGPQPTLWKNPNEKKIIDLKKSMLEREILNTFDAKSRRLFTQIQKQQYTQQPKINLRFVISIVATMVVALFIILITLMILIHNLKKQSPQQSKVIIKL